MNREIIGATPTPEDLAKMQADMDKVTAVANKAIRESKAEEEKKKTPFLTRDAFAGLSWWQVIAGGVGVVAISAGVVSLVVGRKK